MSVSSSKTSPIRIGILCLAAGAATFSVFDVLNKSMSDSLPLVQRLWVYYLAFAAVMAFAVWRRGDHGAWRSARPGLQIARALVLVVETGLFAAAVGYIQLADVQAVAAASPLFVLAVSAPVLGEPVARRAWIAVGLGFIGVLVVVRPGLRELGLGYVLVLLGAALWAVYQVMLRIVGRYDPPSTTALWTSVAGAAAMTLIGPFFWTWPDATGWLMLVGLAACGTLGHVLYSIAFRFAPAAILQPFGYLNLVFAVVWGWLIFGQFPDVWTIAGAALIVVAGLVALRE
jgi:drug/metabolite transporter (DMT)-like permease